MFEKTFKFTMSFFEKRINLFTMPIFFTVLALLGAPYYLLGHYKEDTSGDLSLMFQVPMSLCAVIGLTSIGIGALTGVWIAVPFLYYFGLLLMGKLSNLDMCD